MVFSRERFQLFRAISSDLNEGPRKIYAFLYSKEKDLISSLKPIALVDKISAAEQYVRNHLFSQHIPDAQNQSPNPKVAFVLGSGLNSFLSDPDCTILAEILMRDIPYFPSSTISIQGSSLYLVRLEKHLVLISSGRVHYYEGYSMEEVTFSIRVMKKLGIELLIMSNSAGGLNETFDVSDVVLVKVRKYFFEFRCFSFCRTHRCCCCSPLLLLLLLLFSSLFLFLVHYSYS